MRIRDRRSTDKLRQGSRDVIEQEFQSLEVSCGYELPRCIKVTVRHFILRKVLHLNQAASPAASARSAVELCQPADSTVRASCSQHSVVFFSRGLCKARSNVEHLIYRRAVGVGSYAGDRLLIKALDLYAGGVLNPAFELAGTFRVVEARKLFRLFKQASFDNAVDLNGVLSKAEVNANACLLYTSRCV